MGGIMTLGYISAFSETLAMGVIVAKGVSPLLDALVREPEDHIKAASAWSLGQIGRHSPDHAKALAVQNAFAKLLAVYLNDESSEDLKTKSKRALKAVISKCTHLDALEPLLSDAPVNILKYVVHQFAKVLPTWRHAGHLSHQGVSRRCKKVKPSLEASCANTLTRSTCVT